MPNTISLDGIELNHQMRWVERDQSQKVAQSSYRTIGGGLIVFSGPLTAGARITLTATEETGWLQKSVVDQIKALADVPGATYVLQFHNDSYNVVFRHEESPAVDLNPLVYRINQGADDYYTGTIKLLTV